jgi:large subunit ribosomal protein L6
MSRIGKKPIVIPDKVEVKIEGDIVLVKGPKGSLKRQFLKLVKIEKKDKEVLVIQSDAGSKTDTTTMSSVWGLSRTLLNNMVQGVSVGFTKSLEFTGVGYKAQTSGKNLNLSLGFSHPIEYKLPEGIEAKVDKNTIQIIGCDKELVGFVAAKIRAFRPPEPYKGKGIKYSNETIARKAGKSGAAKG